MSPARKNDGTSTAGGGKMAATARAPCLDGGRQPMAEGKTGDDLAVKTTINHLFGNG